MKYDEKTDINFHLTVEETNMYLNTAEIITVQFNEIRIVSR